MTRAIQNQRQIQGNNYILKIDNIKPETARINTNYTSIKDNENFIISGHKDPMSITFDIEPNKDNEFYTIINTNKYHIGDYVYRIIDKEPFKIVYIRQSSIEVLSYIIQSIQVLIKIFLKINLKLKNYQIKIILY